jgi:hypothetical protein
MTSLEQYREQAHRAVVDTAQAFHLEAQTRSGLVLEVPCSYQILEPGFRPFRAGKAPPEELQQELDGVVSEAQNRGIDIGIEGEESLRKLVVQLGLGIDCSNFAYRSLMRAHDQLDLGKYTDTVFRSAEEIRSLHGSKSSWSAKDANGNQRNLTDDEESKLAGAEILEAGWVADVFGKDPEFIIGSHHMSTGDAARLIPPEETLPGDLIAFNKAGNGKVSHVAVVETVEANEADTFIEFWHAWHTRDFNSGVRRDHVKVMPNSEKWSHEGLADTTRYGGYYFCRPLAMAALVDLIRERQ